MPHIAIEYSSNLKLNSESLFADLASQLLATGVVRTKGIRIRAIKCDEYLLADGHPDCSFIHATLQLRIGRSQEVKEDMAQRCLAVLEQHFSQQIQDESIALSVDIKELLDGTSLNKNSIPVDGK